MQASKRRKVTITPARSASSNGKISAFTRITKAITPSKFLLDKSDTAASQLAKEVECAEIKKRKARAIIHEEEEEEIADEKPSTILASVINQRLIRPLPRRRTTSSSQLSYNTPQRPISTLSSPLPIPVDESPTKAAGDLLAGLVFNSSPIEVDSSPVYSSQQTNAVEYFSSQVPYPGSQTETDCFPTELQDLVNLHSAFLTALSLHYAHNGTHTPADLRFLCPDVARAWGKRRVTLNDIRQSLALLNHISPASINSSQSLSAELSLSDYGMGKICIEIKAPSTRVGRVARPLDENHMNDTFLANLKKMWEERDVDSLAEFLANLPLEPIVLCSSYSKMSPLLAKGQRRLSDFKAGMALKKEVSEAKTTPLKTVTSAVDTVRKPSLLERLRMKGEAQAKLPPPPSKDLLSRGAGLHKIHEVMAVLTLLTTSGSIGQSRVSFTMPTIIGKLKDSIKNPISKDEGEICVRLIAAEIAPEWLSIVQMKKCEAVVVNRDKRPDDEEVTKRVAVALSK